MRYSIRILVLLLLMLLILPMGSISLASLTDEIYEISGKGLRYLLLFGCIASLVCIAIFGILWFMANSQQKAVLKEKIGTYILGIFLVFMGATITIWVVNAVEGIYTSPVVGETQPAPANNTE